MTQFWLHRQQIACSSVLIFPSIYVGKEALNKYSLYCSCILTSSDSFPSMKTGPPHYYIPIVHSLIPHTHTSLTNFYYDCRNAISVAIMAAIYCRHLHIYCHSQHWHPKKYFTLLLHVFARILRAMAYFLPSFLPPFFPHFHHRSPKRSLAAEKIIGCRSLWIVQQYSSALATFVKINRRTRGKGVIL